jgi:outer membrane protein assembly factor BamE (lipoprotein component of BamABCDE complex)
MIEINMSRVLKGIIAILLGMVLAGCATTGNKKIINEKILSEIKIGESTKADVMEILGEPLKVTFTDVEEEVWDYQYVRSKPRATSFLPRLGSVLGGRYSLIHTLTIRFTTDGIVKKIGRGQTTSRAGSVFD